MSNRKSPSDHLNKEYKKKLGEAVSMQASNLLQRAQLDMLATKIICILSVTKSAEVLESLKSAEVIDSSYKPSPVHTAILKISEIASMTREQTFEARKSFSYPDEKIQAVLDRATDEIRDILMGDVE